MKLHAPGILVLLVVVAAAWFGSRLGPRDAERPASMEAAQGAAQGFVETALRREYQKRGQPNAEVTFAPGTTTAEPDAGNEYNAGDPNLWIAEGTATAKGAKGLIAHSWKARLLWDGTRHWRLKALEIMGPRR